MIGHMINAAEILGSLWRQPQHRLSPWDRGTGRYLPKEPMADMMERIQAKIMKAPK